MKKNGADAAFEDVAYKWLRSQHLHIQRDFLVRELTTHEDYPALTSLTDFLDLGGMSYQAIESSPDYIAEFKYPVLAHVREEAKEYMLPVNSPAAFKEEEALKKGWTGIVLFPEGEPQWENEENTRQLKQQRAFMFILALTAILLLTGAAWLLRNLSPLTIIWGLLSLGGLIFSTATIATELGVQIKLVREVCNSFSPRGCDAVLRSNYAKGLWGISIADMSFSYFGIQFLFLLLSVRFGGLPGAAQLISIPLIAGGGVSLYLQKFKLKKWCALCLGIVSVLLLQGAISLTTVTGLLQHISIPALICFFAAQALCCGLLALVKGRIKDIREQLAQAMEFQKWKKDVGLFLSQWENMTQVDTTTWKGELQYGNPQAPVQITVACNPYCGPCAREHERLDKLYHIYKDKINIKVRFICFPGEKDKTTLSVAAIFRRAAKARNSDEVAHLLADWFSFMDLEKWQQKWVNEESRAEARGGGRGNARGDVRKEARGGVRGNAGGDAREDSPGDARKDDPNVDALLEKNASWMKIAEIKGTPTTFINGRQLPKRYMVDDLAGLIPSLAEIHHADNFTN